MSARGFPRDEYTPFGYLANPYAVARSWSEGKGGNLRSTDDSVGFGWLYPWARGAEAGAQIEIGVGRGSELMLARSDFERAGLYASHHSANLFEYTWSCWGVTWCARFVLVGENELGVEVEIDGASMELTLYLAVVGWRQDRTPCIAEPGSTSSHGSVDLGAPFGTHELWVETMSDQIRRLGTATSRQDLVAGRGHSRPLEAGRVGVGVAVTLAGGSSVAATLRRKRGGESEVAEARRPEPVIVSREIEEARRRDDRFWRGAARLEGDWPASWRRGWVHDVETTRMCVFPAGGIFRDVWPAWMIQWPRVVLAEGSLDLARLAYADPDLAKRAALSMVRDAPAPNVPCVFQHAEPNMVAADGSVCGTSPSWCVPFYNFERLYLRTLDRAWLNEIYPFLARYLQWWLEERTDPDGWAMYKCTWEAGEDDTPRLDPERRGDNVVSELVRPVELQATMALSATVLGRFADELGEHAEAARWQGIAGAFTARTQELWDAQASRFRDWDCRRNGFLEPSGQTSYWGVDPCRYSALSFTPLLAGLAREDQRRAMAEELEHYATPPWTLWPSWSYVVLESALAMGERAFAARVAASIVGRVYDELDRRTRGEPRGPTPGVAREYWPLDLGTWNACEGYGWGATTASFLVRQILGFLESESTSGVRFRLGPGLPEALLESGRRYAIVNMPYRGHSLDLEYAVLASADGSDARLTVRVSAEGASSCVVVDEDGVPRYESVAPLAEHHFGCELGGLYEVELQPAPTAFDAATPG
jgi:hypothetical protein